MKAETPGESHVLTRAETRDAQYSLVHKGCSKALEARRGGRFPLQVSEGVWPCQHLDLGHEPPELRCNKFLLFSATQLVGFFSKNPTKLIKPFFNFSLWKRIKRINAPWV